MGTTCCRLSGEREVGVGDPVAAIRLAVTANV